MMIILMIIKKIIDRHNVDTNSCMLPNYFCVKIDNTTFMWCSAKFYSARCCQRLVIESIYLLDFNEEINRLIVSANLICVKCVTAFYQVDEFSKLKCFEERVELIKFVSFTLQPKKFDFTHDWSPSSRLGLQHCSVSVCLKVWYCLHIMIIAFSPFFPLFVVVFPFLPYVALLLPFCCPFFALFYSLIMITSSKVWGTPIVLM